MMGPVRASSLAARSAVRAFTSAARTLSSSCASRRAPMMVEVTPGWRVDPGQRDARDRGLVRLGDGLQLVDERVGLLVEEGIDERAAIGPACRPFLRGVLAAEHAALERRPRRDAEAQLARHRHQLLLDGALEQRVLDLQADERRPAAEPRDDVGLGDLPRRRVGDAEVADLARAHEIVERGHRLLDRRVRVPVVQPVEIDVVGLQAAQRLLAGGDDRLAARAAAVRIARIEVAAELGGDDEAVALRAVCGRCDRR